MKYYKLSCTEECNEYNNYYELEYSMIIGHIDVDAWNEREKRLFGKDSMYPMSVYSVGKNGVVSESNSYDDTVVAIYVPEDQILDFVEQEQFDAFLNGEEE